MDNSKEYIRMCFMADKYLRPLYKFEKGDWIFSPADTFTPKVLSDFCLIVSDKHRVVTIAFPKSPIDAFVAHENDTIPSMETHIDKVDFYRIPEPMWCRLHRQDQLQAIVSGTKMSLVCGFKDFFIRPIFDETAPYSFDIFSQISMEQLWLMFVMYNKFNKVWNGSFWKAIE
jgi:hypothetical protein